MAYNPSIPNPTDLLSDSQPQLKANFTAANNSFGTDHFPFDDGTSNNGYHQLAHLVSRGNAFSDSTNKTSINDPPTIAGTNIIYSKAYTPDTSGGTPDIQLFAETAGGGKNQLTGSFTPAKLSAQYPEGWCWVGGVLLQWGQISASFSSGSTTGTLMFKDRVTGAIPFPNNCYIVTGSPLVTFASLPSSQGSVNISQNSISATSFRWQFYTNSSEYIGFTWFAIGN